MRHAALACVLGVALAAGAARAAGSPSGVIQGRVLVNPLSIVVLVPSDPVKAGRDFRIRAEVANAGSSAVQDVAVSLVAPPGLVLRDPITQVLRRVGPAEARNVRWDACATAVGGYVVMARAVAGPLTIESAGQVVQIAAAKRPSC